MNVVQVGAGKMGQVWLDALIAAPGVQLVGIVEPVNALREAALAKTAIPKSKGFRSVKDALAALDFDAAVVVTPPPTHRPIAGQLLEAGKHVLTEKPLATTLNDAQELVEIAARADRILMVAQNYRYVSAFATVRDLIAQNEIGRITALTIQFHKDGRTMFGDGDFRYSMEHVLLLDMSIHHFDMIRAATASDAAQVYAQTWHIPDGNFAHHAAASVILTMTNGIVVTYTGNWATHSRETSWNGDWEIVGARGRIVWSGSEGVDQITLQHWDQEPRAVPIQELDRIRQSGLIADFARSVESGNQPETAAGSNVRSLAIVFAAVESADTGRVVALTEAMI